MTIVKTPFRRNELRFGIKYHEVGIEILRDAALARFTSSNTRRSLCHPPRDIRKGESSSRSLRPHNRQRQRETRNPSPRRSKVALAQSLHLRRTGRVIRRHQINHSLLKPLPKFFAILPAANRRRALEQCLAVRDLIRGDRKSTRLNSSHLVISYAV